MNSSQPASLGQRLLAPLVTSVWTQRTFSWLPGKLTDQPMRSQDLDSLLRVAGWPEIHEYNINANMNTRVCTAA